MKLNIMAFVMMIIAIAIGNILGGYLLDYIGGTYASGIFGSLIVGFVCYIVYALATKSKIRLMSGIFFAVLVYVAGLLAGYVSDAFALGSADLMVYVVTGAIMAVLWGWIGGKTGSKAVRLR